MFVFTHIASLLLNGIGSLQKVRCLTLVFGLLLTGIGFPLYAQIEQEFCIDKFPDKIEICVDLEPGEFLDPDGSTSVFDCSLSPSGDFCVKYTPLPLFEGPDTVLIQICKIADPDDCYFLTYIVYVGCIQPDAVNDAANANGTTTIDVTANDWVKCADISGIKIKTNPTHGTAVVSGLNIIYTPDECYNGTDKIIYELINSCGKKDVATVNLTVSANNVAPDAKNDTGTSTDGNQVCVSVLNNDFDADGDAMTINTFGQGTNGVVVKSGNKLCYTPNSGFSGTDVFTYKICDPCNLCDQATVAITVEKLNQPPVANNDEGTTEGDPVCIKVMTNDYDPDGDPIAVTTYTQPIKGSVNYNPSTKEFCFTPTNNCFDYVTTFKYTICDDGSPKLCDEATVTITVNGDNQPPVLKNDNATSDGSTVCINVLANDNDPDGDVLHISNYTQPANGSVVIDPGTKKLCYTPNSGFEGTDSFQYCSCDPCGETSCATVTIIVELPNNPPVANNDEGTTEGDPVCIKVMTNDYDPDGDPIAVTNYGQPSQGTVTYNPLTKELCYDPKDDCYEGVVTFSYTICDNGSPKLCDDAVVTITVINDNIAPDAKNDALESDGSQVCKNVLSNDSDADGDVLSISMYGQGSNGVVIKAGSQLCYTPNAGFEGSDSFTYTVCDDCGLCDQATVTVTVDIPCEPEVLEICADPLIPVTVCPQFCLEDWTIVEVEALFKCGIKLKEKCFIYTALPGQFGSDELIVKACDDFGNCETTIVYVIIGCGGNQPPFAQNDDVTTPQNQEGCLYPMNNDFDPDGDPITIEAISPPANGFIIYDDETGEFCYTPGLGFSGVEIFTYQVCDNKGACTSATITIVVTTDCEEDLFLCTKPLTPIIICPAFCTLNGEVQIIDAETTYNCSIKILPDGCVKYTSLPLFAGQETVTITGCDTNGNCETVTYIIEVSEDCDGEGFGLIPEHKDEIGSETSNKGQSGTPKMQINVSNYINGHVSIAYFVPTETVYRLAVTDMSGRLVYNTTVDASVSGWQPQMNLPTQHLSKGVYLVTITQDNDRANKVSAKFIAF